MYIHISIISINGKFFCDGEFLDHYLKSVQENVVYKESSVFKEKTNSKIKLNSEHFFLLVTLEINANWRMNYFL